jgi:hypothetical protein
MAEKATKSNYNLIFWAHLALVAIGWLGPFLIDWRWMCIGYAVIFTQFMIFDKCLLNAEHGVDDTKDDYTFYAELFEAMGYFPNRKLLKKVVRTWLYFFLAAVAIGWQVGLGMKPLLF